MFLKLFLITLILPYFKAQDGEKLYFPNEDDSVSQVINRGETLQILPQVNLSEIRGTRVYENYVDQIISTGISKLTLAINKVLVQDDHYDNVVFSPVSISGALALVLLGSNGKTFQEITDVMGLATGVDIQTKSHIVHEQFGRMLSNLETNSGFQLGSQVSFASAIFVQNSYPIRSLYKQTAEELYKSEILNVDFESNPGVAQSVINAWVSQRTNGKIKDLLADAPSVSTKVIIASAMYFKAEWEHPFFEGGTRKRPFYINGRKSPTNIEAEMMSNGGNFPYFKDRTLNCEIMGFPYKGNGSTMYIIMPLDSNKEKLKQFEEKLSPTELNRLVDATVYTASVVLFPKMRIDSTIDLKESLELLGVKSLFNPSESNLALLSPGDAMTSTPLNLPSNLASVEKNPLQVPQQKNEGSQLIFNRLGEKVNCTKILQLNNITKCTEVSNSTQQTVVYKKFGSKLGRKIVGRIGSVMDGDTLDNIRVLINQQSSSNKFQNPGLYADKVIHKVYMDITETGTEAAAATSVSLSRDGGRVTFRVDVPFFFFIRHEQTKTVLFWGSVNSPTPSFKKSST